MVAVPLPARSGRPPLPLHHSSRLIAEDVVDAPVVLQSQMPPTVGVRQSVTYIDVPVALSPTPGNADRDHCSPGRMARPRRAHEIVCTLIWLLSYRS
jgi:hypothetical protein